MPVEQNPTQGVSTALAGGQSWGPPVPTLHHRGHEDEESGQPSPRASIQANWIGLSRWVGDASISP